MTTVDAAAERTVREAFPLAAEYASDPSPENGNLQIELNNMLTALAGALPNLSLLVDLVNRLTATAAGTHEDADPVTSRYAADLILWINSE